MLQWGMIGCKAQTIEILSLALENGVAPSLVATLENRPAEETQEISTLTKLSKAIFIESNDLQNHIEVLKQIDILIVCRYNLLPESVYNAPKVACINVHSSLLPKYRGVHPVSWALIRGEAFTGITIHHIDHAIDTGSTIMQSRVAIEPDHDIWSLTEALNRRSSKMVVELLKNSLPDGIFPDGYPQRRSQDFYARRREPADGKINWHHSAMQIERLVRALQAPLPFAFTLDHQGNQFTVHSCRVLSKLHSRHVPPGTVIKENENRYIVQCIDLPVEIHCQQQIPIGITLK